jgi:hypothetical protein
MLPVHCTSHFLVFITLKDIEELKFMKWFSAVMKINVT